MTYVQKVYKNLTVQKVFFLSSRHFPHFAGLIYLKETHKLTSTRLLLYSVEINMIVYLLIHSYNQLIDDVKI